MYRLTIYLERLSRLLNIVGGWVCLPILTALITVDVVSRYLFNSPIIGGLELSSILLMMVFLLGIPECTRTGGHLRMEILSRRMSSRIKRVVTLLYDIVGISIFGLLAKNELKEIKYNFSLSRATEYLDIPIWPLHIIIMFVSLCIIAQFLIDGFASIKDQTRQKSN